MDFLYALEQILPDNSMMRSSFFMILLTMSSMTWSMEHTEEKVLTDEGENQIWCTTFNVAKYPDENGELFAQMLKNASVEENKVIKANWSNLFAQSPDQHDVWESGQVGNVRLNDVMRTLWWGKLNQSKCEIVQCWQCPVKERKLICIADDHFLYHVESTTYEIILEKIRWNDKNGDDIENTH